MAAIGTPVRGRIVVALLAIAVGLAAAEIGLRGWFAATNRTIRDYIPPVMLEGWSREYRYVSHPFLPYHPRPNFRIPERPANYNLATFPQGGTQDTWGIRGGTIPSLRKPPGEFRIVCIGGSTTYGEGLDENTWPALLERRLVAAMPGRAVRVVNLGVENFTSHMDLVRFSMLGVALEPDVVIVYSGINDAWLLGAASPMPDGSHGIRDLAMESRGLQRRIPALALEHSALLAVTSRLVDREVFGVHYDLFNATFGSFARDPSDATRGIEFYENNLRSIAILARGHGARVLLSTLHHYRDPANPGFAKVVDETLNPAIRRAAAAAGVELVEPISVIPTDDRSLHADVAHFTGAGREAMAEFLSQKILAGPSTGSAPR